MVSGIIRNFVAVFFGVVLVTPSFGSAQQSYDDGSLAVRGEGMYGDINARSIYSDLDTREWDDEFFARDYHNPTQGLSVRAYIDEQINLALRAYDDSFQALHRRATESQIKANISTWTRRYNDAKAKLRPAQQKEKDAKKALDKDPQNKTLQTAYRRAGNDVHTIRESMHGAEDELDHWKHQKASPSPGPSSGRSPGGSHSH